MEHSAGIEKILLGPTTNFVSSLIFSCSKLFKGRAELSAMARPSPTIEMPIHPKRKAACVRSGPSLVSVFIGIFLADR